MSVTLYPMVHIGDESFYRQTYDEAFSQDVTLIEGVRSSVTRSLTRTYRWINFDKLGLVQQPKPPAQAAVAARIVNADLTADEFHREWRKVSFPLRAAFFIGAPLVGIQRRFFSSRESLAANMCLEDRKSGDELLSWTPRLEPVHQSVLHARDNRLIRCLLAELEASPDKRVAVVYGAMHMRAVVRALMDQGFYVSDSRWRTLISI